MKRIRTFLSFLAALGAFLLLTAEAGAAREGAVWGLRLCGGTLLPSLLPVFAAAGLLNALGLPEWLAGRLEGTMRRLFGVSGAGAAVFLLGLTGGYPLGSAAIAQYYREGRLSRAEAEKLIFFCDNTGPAFLLGAVGQGVFRSVRAGLFLYAVHVLAAVTLGFLCRSRAAAGPSRPPEGRQAALPFSAALPFAVDAAARSVIRIVSFVVFFSALLSALNAHGLLSLLTGALAARLGGELIWWRAALESLLELSGGVGRMAGFAPTPGNLALAAFAVGWGGLCVHCQSLGAAADTDLRFARRAPGKLLHALLSAALALALGRVFF